MKTGAINDHSVPITFSFLSLIVFSLGRAKDAAILLWLSDKVVIKKNNENNKKDKKLKIRRIN